MIFSEILINNVRFLEKIKSQLIELCFALCGMLGFWFSGSLILECCDLVCWDCWSLNVEACFCLDVTSLEFLMWGFGDFTILQFLVCVFLDLGFWICFDLDVWGSGPYLTPDFGRPFWSRK